MKIEMSKLRFFILFCIICSPGLMIPQLIVNDEPSVQDVPLTTETVMQQTASLSMPFIKNEGQADPQVKFYANTFAGTVYLTENNLTYAIPTEDGSFVIKESPHGGDLTPSADTPSETTVNYFKGTKENWHTDVPTYDSVSAGFVWDGVSLSLKAYGNNIEKLFTVFPGTNPNVIKMNFDGVESLSVDKSGELLLHTSVGDITMTAPIAYQHVDGIKKFVPVKYSISSASYGFVLGDYEKTLPVVIDPLLASTFLGGSKGEQANAIAIDSSGNVFVTGQTSSTNFPTTSGAYDESLDSTGDAFVSKFSNDLTSLSASTYLGGSIIAYGNAIAIDSSDNVFVSGDTTSNDFPTTSGAYDESKNGEGTNSDTFVSKFSNDLTSLSASTYLGGTSGDWNDIIAFDSSDNVFVAGHTAATNFPTTDGAYDESFRSGSTTNAYVSKFSNDLTSLSASTFVSTSYRNHGALAIDSSDNVFVAGATPNGFATTDGAYDESFNDGNYDGHVSKFSNDLTSLSASTYLGGSGQNDTPYALAIDSSDNVFVTGRAGSTDFPTTSGAYDESYGGSSYDVFVSKFSNDLTSLSASTFLGDTSNDYSWAIAIDSSDNVFVSGYTGSTDFPTTSGAYDESHDGSAAVSDAFVSKFSNDLTSLSASTFLGGTSNDYGYDIAVDSSDNVFVTGQTASTGFPTTSGAYDESQNGISDAFVSKFSSNLNLDVTSPTVTITSSSGDSGDAVGDTTLSYTVTFNESTSNFVVGDITVTGTANGGSPAASNFAGSGTTYTFDVVQGSSDGTVSVSVAAGAATDTAGNDNTVSNTYTFTIDTVGPTVTITSSSGDSGSSISAITLSYTATFSKSITGFTIGDITVSGSANAKADNFAGSGTTYTFDVIKNISDGDVDVKIGSGVATDSAGNNNIASNTYSFSPVTFTSGTSTSGTCSRHVILGNCGTIAINNDEYRIINTWTNVPTTEVLVGQPVTVTLSTPNNPTHTKIHFASVHTEVFSIPANFDQTAHIDYSIMSDSYSVTKAKLFQVAAATHRIAQDPDVKNLEMFEVVFTMIFAKPMETSHVVVETQNKFGIPETLYLMSALKVDENLAQALTLEEKSKFSIVEPEMEPEMDPEMEMDPEPEQTKKEKSKRQRR